MTSIIVLCAIKFLSVDPIPPMLVEIYKTNYSCERFIPLQKDLASEKLENVNKYFPAQRPSWPLITSPLDKNSDEIANKWIKHGIKPGFLLPPKHLDDPKLFKQLQRLKETGAIPVATLNDESKSKVEAQRYYWCMHGVCPAAWYLKNGIHETITLLPNGLYVSASHWYKKPELPIPDRMMEISGKEILPWNQVRELSSIDDKFNDDPFVTYYFTPKIQESWKWLGVDFYYENGTLHTNLIGKTMLYIGELSFWMWDRFHLIKINLFSLINENFSWIAVIIALLNIIMLIGSIIRRKGMTE